MRVIICGGRTYDFTAEDVAWLDNFHAEHAISEVITGRASGADFWAIKWTEDRALNCVMFPANWAGEGKSAGPLRNMRMLEYLEMHRRRTGEAIAIVAFPGGKGTRHMCNTASKKYGVRVYYVHQDSPFSTDG